MINCIIDLASLYMLVLVTCFLMLVGHIVRMVIKIESKQIYMGNHGDLLLISVCTIHLQLIS